MKMTRRSERQLRSWEEMLHARLRWTTLFAVVAFSMLMWFEPYLQRQYIGTYEIHWLMGRLYLVRPLLLLPVGAALAVWVMAAFDRPPRISRSIARLLAWAPPVLILLYSVHGYLWWNTEALSPLVLELVAWAGPFCNWIALSGSWFLVLLSSLSTVGRLLLSLDRSDDAPRRDALTHEGGDPWMQIPYHRRSIGVDPDSKWDFGND